MRCLVKVRGAGFGVPGLRRWLRGRSLGPRTSNLEPDSGLTLIELIICVTIVSILACAALPVARFQVKRQRERELRRDLWDMRDAIDKYKDAYDRGGILSKQDSMGYPPDLQTLVDGVDVRDLAPSDLNRAVGIVLQEPFLFRGTIYENQAVLPRFFLVSRLRAARKQAALA